MTTVAIVTVTYNSSSVLPEFLECITAQDTECVLIVVDNASTDDSLALVAADGPDNAIVLPQVTNTGISIGNNVGICEAQKLGAEFVLLLNNDTAFVPDFVSSLLAVARNNTADIVVPSIRYYEDPAKVWFERARFSATRGLIPVALPPSADLVDAECACTCGVLIHRSVFEQVGLMDEAFFLYFDDTDFFRRCFDAKFRMVLEPKITLLHKVSSLSGGLESNFSFSHTMRNRIVYIRKHSRRRFLPTAYLGSVIVMLRVALSSPPRGCRVGIGFRALRQGFAYPLNS